MFWIDGVGNRQNVKIWGTEPPEEYNLVVSDSPIFYDMVRNIKRTYNGHICFWNLNVIDESYSNMLIRYAFPSFRHLQQNSIFWPRWCFSDSYKQSKTLFQKYGSKQLRENGWTRCLATTLSIPNAVWSHVMLASQFKDIFYICGLHGRNWTMKNSWCTWIQEGTFDKSLR